MKRTELAKNLGKKIAGRQKPFGAPDLDAIAKPALDKREQRKLDQAAGLVPFACKLNTALIEKLKARAQQDGSGLNETVAMLLEKGLSQP
jgi:hypothetical protein